MELTENQLVVLFRRFDAKGEGCIRIDAFLRVIVGSMNRRRRKLVDMAFDVLDKDGSGVVGYCRYCRMMHFTVRWMDRWREGASPSVTTGIASICCI